MFRTRMFSRLMASAVVCGIAILWLPRANAQSSDTLKIGVLTVMSSLYADNAGQGSVVAAQMAVDDFGGTVLGRKIEVLAADHQNKADVGSAITRQWIDQENVEAILDGRIPQLRWRCRILPARGRRSSSPLVQRPPV